MGLKQQKSEFHCGLVCGIHNMLQPEPEIREAEKGCSPLLAVASIPKRGSYSSSQDAYKGEMT